MEIVNRHVGQLQLNRTIWRETRLMLDANPRINGLPFYFHWITEQYHVAQAIGVRRQLDSAETHQQTLGRLLTLLEGGAEQITRDWFMGMYSSQPQMQEIGQHDFDAFAGPKDTSVPSEWFSTTLDALTELARPIRNYVNRRIAHIDAREVPNPEIAILDAVIDAMSEATVKLSLLLTATDLLSPQPTIQFDWAEGLEVPWLHQDRQQ